MVRLLVGLLMLLTLTGCSAIPSWLMPSQKGITATAVGTQLAQEATQQMMKYMFPGMMFFLFYAFPSGLNLYYLCFNIMQIVQQKIINSETTQDPVAH